VEPRGKKEHDSRREAIKEIGRGLGEGAKRE
jgi:hypothetical protein